MKKLFKTLSLLSVLALGVSGCNLNNKEEELKEIIWKDIKEQVNSKLTNFKHIKNLIITDEPMIKTTTNKIKRKEEMKKILA